MANKQIVTAWEVGDGWKNRGEVCYN